MRKYAGGRPSQSSVSPKPPTLLGTETSVTSSMCNTVDFLSVCCGIQSGTLCRSGFLGSSALIVEWYTELVSKLFNIYNESLFQSFFWTLRYLRWNAAPIQLHSHNPRTGRPASASVPFRVLSFFLSAGSVSQRERISVRAVAEEGWYNLGPGRGRYCGRVSCLSQRRVLALPQWF